jgi:uncharacterized protein (TIGR02302 family)
MRTRVQIMFGTGTSRWRQAGLALVFGLSIAFAWSVDMRGAAAAGTDCVPAEPPMGTARDSLKDTDRESGLRSQEGAIGELQKCLAQKEKERSDLLKELNNILSNLQMAQPGQGGDDDDDMMSALDELGNMIREQQQLRDKTFRQGQDQRRGQQRGQRGQQGQQGQQGQGQQGQQGQQFGDLQKNQQALRDRLKQLMDQLKQKGFGQGEPGQQGENDPLGEAGDAMADAEGALGEGNPDGAVDSQGRALDKMRQGAQSLAQQLQQQMGQNQGPGQPGRQGQARANQETDPLGRPLRGRDLDDSTVKVPLEADVQRARRILDELRRRFGETGRPQLELDYIERLLKDY